MNILKLQRRNIQFRIDSLQEYNSFIEENIEKELYIIQKKFEEASKEYEEYQINTSEKNDDDDYMLDYFDDLNYSHNKIQDNILLKHRNSITFLLYSLIEDELYAYAKHNTFNINNVFTIDDLKGNSTFEKFKNYISKTNPNLYESIKVEIEYFDRIRLLRNFITHHNNFIKSDHTNYHKIKGFSINRFELKQIGFIHNTKIEGYIIKLNDKKIIVEIFNNLNALFDKMYLID